jgi:CRISPR-associated endonuclease Csn1
MQGELTKRLSHFKSAVKKLQDDAPDMPVTGSLIRKCRIAMDMGWKCPFTLKTYDVHQLTHLEREHIIPYADRPTNALDALVLTFPEVNSMKAKRLAYAFVDEFQSMEVEGAPHLTICTLTQYSNFVKKLKSSAGKKKTHPEDYHRQSSRVKWMLLKEYEAKDQGFTQGTLTQTSHLNRLSAGQLEKRFIDPETDEPTVRIHTIPGQVTAEARKAWRLLGTMAQACPEIKNKDGTLKTKTEVRGITHLHHALDAVTLGLMHTYLPGSLPGQFINEKGAIWQAMLKRNKTVEDQGLLMETGMFAKHYKNRGDASDKELDVHLIDIPKEVKEQVSERLNEKRVMQHIPSDQSGATLELNPWRLRHIVGEYAIITQAEGDVVASSADSRVSYERKKPLGEKELKARLGLVEQCPAEVFSSRERNLIHRGLLKITKEKSGKLVGLRSGKLAANKSVLVISDNYGLALDPEPTIIPHHRVSKELAALRRRNGGKKVRVLRNGMLIRISGWRGKEGIWRIASCKAALTLDLVSPVRAKMESSGADFWREVSVLSVLKKGSIEMIPNLLTGYNGL